MICNSKEVKTIKFKENNENIAIVEQDSKGSLKYKSIDNEVSVALNSNGLLFKVTYPCLLPNKKANYTEGLHNRIRLSYEYASISQVFSIFDYPKQ